MDDREMSGGSPVLEVPAAVKFDDHKRNGDDEDPKQDEYDGGDDDRADGGRVSGNDDDDAGIAGEQSAVVHSVLREYDIIQEAEQLQLHLHVSSGDEDHDDNDIARPADGNSSTDTDAGDDCVLQILPKVNCREKLIICLDLSSEMNTIPFTSKDGTKYQPLQMVKRAINIFVHTKAAIKRSHEFALVVLQDSALWMHDFTSNTDEFCYVLADLSNDCEYSSFDFSSLFDLISEKVEMPTVNGAIELIPPEYIVRTIVIYGRSNTVPEFINGKESQKRLMLSPYFFLDIFYIHEMPSEDNNCEEVFNKLCDLDEGGKSFVFEVCRNPTYLHDNMAKLVAHPLQRPLQKGIKYKLHHELG